MNTWVANWISIGGDQGKGFAVSIFVHLLIVVWAISATSKIEAVPKLLVIDFTINESFVEARQAQSVKTLESVDVPPEVKSSKKIRLAASPKKVLVKKVLPQTPKIIAVQKIKIATIKEKRVPEVVPVSEPVPQPLPEQITAGEISPLESIDKKETPILAEKTLAPFVAVFPTPSAGKSRLDNDQTKVSKYSKAHFSRIQQGIQQHIRYPRTARRMGWEGKVVVAFIICKDGTVKNLHIVESSGFKALDKNAVATIKKAAPFPIPPIPAKIIVPVVYRLS